MAPWVQGRADGELQVDAYPDRPFTGEVSRISPAVNTQTRAFPFEALVPNPQGLLKPGTFARVHLETALRRAGADASRTPRMQYRYGVNRAFVVNGDSSPAAKLKIGDRAGRPHGDSGRRQGRRPWSLTDVDNLADGMKVVSPTRRRSSACCPNSASGVRSSPRCSCMSLVVLGIFSFRDLGVDLFPKADPATVNVRCGCRAPGPTR